MWKYFWLPFFLRLLRCLKCVGLFFPQTLVFALIGSYVSEMVREYILVNLSSSLERMPQVPVGVVGEPAVKQYLLYGYMNLDFEFMVALARHGTLHSRCKRYQRTHSFQ